MGLWLYVYLCINDAIAVNSLRLTWTPSVTAHTGIIIITRGIFPRVNPGIIRQHETDATTNQRLGLSSSDQ